MKVEFIEKYTKLSDLKPGQVAVSKNRNRFFVCGHYFCNFKKENISVVLDINALHDQYPDRWDMDQLVKVLDYDDAFLCTVKNIKQKIHRRD